MSLLHKQIRLFSLIFISCIISGKSLFAQKKSVSLKEGHMFIELSTDSKQIDQAWEKGKSGMRSNVILAFNEKPTKETIAILKINGIELLHSISENIYETILSKKPSTSFLEHYGVVGISVLPADIKFSKSILNQIEKLSEAENVSVSVLLHERENPDSTAAELVKLGFSPFRKAFNNLGLFYGTIPAGKLNELASIRSVRYINLATSSPEPLNFRERGVFGTTMLTNSQSGRNLNGNGIVVGVGDNADPTSHLDLQNNVINRSPAPIGGSAHGTHVSGTISGDGIIEERWTGSAPGSTIISDYFDYIIAKTSTYIDDYGMTVTNNSYFNGLVGCPGNGDYNELSFITDQQIKENPYLEHIFAAGNDGARSCSPYPSKFGTIKSGYQISKNVLTVGNCDIVQTNNIDPNSSRGPVNDGRIKPEIIASGNTVASTVLNNTYNNGWGTSHATPFVTGIWALLSERYKQLNNSNPKSGLLKSILCNTATDKGRPGPDFENGFGWIHPQRALRALEEGRYLSGEISQDQTQQYSITIPAGTKQVKIMLYWHDPAGVPYSQKVLQHDLDLKVYDGGNNYLPWVLNPTPSLILNNAVRAVDRINNIEQITIDNPGTTFQLSVFGFDIANGPQEYFLTWDYVQEGLQLIHPIGGERFTTAATAGNRTETISWEATDTSSNSFTLEYSLDNGNSWTLISSTVASNEFRFYWAVPNIYSSNAKIRVSRNGTSLSSSSPGNFTIMGIPNLTVTNPCEGYADLNWTAVSNAQDYEVLQLSEGVFQRIATVNALTLRVNNLDRNTRYWFTIRPRIADSLGRRGTARTILPNISTPCTQAAFDNDLKIDTLLSPANGRLYTSSQLSNQQDITVRIKNLDNAASSSSYTVFYQINNENIISEQTGTPISAGGVLDYTFNTKANLSSIGDYSIRLWVKQTGDNQPANDEKTYLVRQIDNPPVSLPHSETFESTNKSEYRTATFAIPQAEKFDFLPSTTNGRFRTYINQGMSLEGSRSAVLDAAQFFGNFNTNNLTGTFNLSNITSTEGLRIDFLYRNHGQLKLPSTTLSVRGNDVNNWLPALTIEQKQEELDKLNWGWINLEEILNQNGQAPGSSFQIRFTQQGRTSANNAEYDPSVFDLDDGYSFDNIRLSVATNDLTVSKITGPDSLNCISSSKTVRILVKNLSNNSLTNIPVSYRVDNNAVITEQISSIGPKSEIQYTFATPANIDNNSTHSIDAWVSLPSDNYAVNDSVLGYKIFNSPVISQFPYLQSFENNKGDFFTTGRYESWEWGKTDTFTRSLLVRSSNGQKAWFTSLYGGYKPNEFSYLYSPCFDLSILSQPVISFAHFSNQEDNRDFHTLEYTTNNGLTWQRLGSNGNGTNWFNTASLNWSISIPRWHVSSIDIPTNASNVRFRFLLSSDAATQREGIGIDDIHIFEKETIYTGSDLLNEPLTLQKNTWNNLKKGQELVFSVNPYNQDLGNFNVSMFTNTDPVRSLNNQFYLDRNYVLQSANLPADSIGIRIYFTEQEINRLLQASPCTNCTRFVDAFRASVTSYKGLPEFENNILNDGYGGNYTFYDSTKVLIVPFNNGYMAEWKVKSLGEFWIHAKDFELTQIPLSVDNNIESQDFIKNTWFAGKSTLTIQTNTNQRINGIQLRLINSSGQQVFQTTTRYQNQTIETGELASGLYIIEIRDEKGTKRYTQKLFKQ